MLQRSHRIAVVNDQRGFTLVELLVTMAIALIVLAATLNALNVFSRDSNAMTQRNAAQNQARLAVDRITRQLRNIASPVASPKLLERATPYDVVFETVGSPSGLNTAGTQRVRYCIPADTAAGNAGAEVMIAQTQSWTTATPASDPWSSDPTVTIPCPDTAYPSTILVSGVTNRYRQRTDRPAFTYNGVTSSTNLTTVDTVGLDLFVNPTPQLGDAETELRSTAYLRNLQRPPVASFTYTPLGGGAVLLNAGTSYDPAGEPLTYSWTCSSSCASSAGVFSWKPGAGTYTVTLTVTDPAGLETSSSPTTVTVT
jgi:prepilin-type N-terminal cleavage/methylation domain-containing protein